jgi:hypothetical protein
MPLTPWPIAGAATELPPHILARYVGEYEFHRQFTVKVTLSVTLENGVLMMQVTGRERAPIFAESETTFFDPSMDARFTFVMGVDCAVTVLILHQPGFNRTVKKVRS